MDLDEMLRVDRCRDMDELINFWARSGSQSRSRNRIFAFQRDTEEVGRISIKFNVSIAAGTWSNWLGFEPDPDQSSDPGTRFTPNFF